MVLQCNVVCESRTAAQSSFLVMSGEWGTTCHAAVLPHLILCQLHQLYNACLHIPCLCISLYRPLGGTTLFRFHIQSEVQSSRILLIFLEDESLPVSEYMKNLKQFRGLCTNIDKYHTYQRIYHLCVNQKKCTFLKLLYMPPIVSTYMFRSLVWPSSTCSTV